MALCHGGAWGLAGNWDFVIWLMLTLAALLTAFYTGRQVFLTFAGKPRTEAAAHAPESVPSMVWPLIILAVFATFLGLAGMPWANLFFKLIGDNAEVAGQHLHHGAFSPLIAAISLGVAVIGWLVAWLIYGRKPLTEPVDPLEKAAGSGLHPAQEQVLCRRVLQRHHRPARHRLAGICSIFDRVVIDAIVNAVGRFGRWLSTWLMRAHRQPHRGRRGQWCGQGYDLVWRVHARHPDRQGPELPAGGSGHRSAAVGPVPGSGSSCTNTE